MKVLVLLAEDDEVIERSSRNLPNVMTLLANYLNIRDALGADYVVIPLDALSVIESLLGKTQHSAEPVVERESAQDTAES